MRTPVVNRFEMPSRWEALLSVGRVLGPRGRRVLTLAAAAMFPSDTAITVTAESAGCTAKIEAQLRQIPVEKALLIRLLLLLVDVIPVWLGPRRVFFRSLAIGEAQITLQRMAHSRWYFFRLSVLSLRTLLCMAYVGDAEVARRLGYTPNNTPLGGPL